MKTQPQAQLDKVVVRFKSFYIYVISRHLAGLLLSTSKKATCAEVLKTRVQDFIVFKSPPPRHSLKNRMKFWPAQNKMYLITGVDSVQM